MIFMRDNAKNSTVLVVGATGLLGTEICQLLAESGRKVKALVREGSDPDKVKVLQKMGVSKVKGDLKDPGSLAKAMKGTNAVISTASASFSHREGDSIETVDNKGQLNLVKAAEDAGVGQFVFISFYPMKSEFALQTAKREVEKKLKGSKLNYTILQPGFFMEIWLSPAVGFDFTHANAKIYGEGINKIHWISYKDVAAFAVASLGKKEASKVVFPLGGPDALSPLEVIRVFEDEIGTHFSIEHVHEDALHAQKSAATDSLSESFAGLMLAYAQGTQIHMKEILKLYPIKMRSVKDYAKQSVHAAGEVHH
jgi:NADH dehydrogenase